MGNLISFFLLSRLTTEPETSNHHERLDWPNRFLEAEHSYNIQVQQTTLLMPTLGSTPLLEQKSFNLGLNLDLPDEQAVFSAQG